MALIKYEYFKTNNISMRKFYITYICSPLNTTFLLQTLSSNSEENK
jgi:hypothetical protein